MKLERRVHAVYNLYVVLEYSKVIYSVWNLLSDWLPEIWRWGLIIKGHKETFWGDRNVLNLIF